MDTWGYVVVIAGAIVIGMIAEYAIREEFGYAWILTAVGAAVGAYVASEYLGWLSNWGTQWQGLRVFPALIGAVVVALAVEVLVSYATSESPTIRGGGREPLPR